MLASPSLLSKVPTGSTSLPKVPAHGCMKCETEHAKKKEKKKKVSSVLKNKNKKIYVFFDQRAFNSCLYFLLHLCTFLDASAHIYAIYLNFHSLLWCASFINALVALFYRGMFDLKLFFKFFFNFFFVTHLTSSIYCHQQLLL